MTQVDTGYRHVLSVSLLLFKDLVARIKIFH